jgi:hypothetical protein
MDAIVLKRKAYKKIAILKALPLKIKLVATKFKPGV